MGWATLVYLGLEGLGVWCSWFFFLFLFWFFLGGFALFLFSCWIVFGVGCCSAFVFFFSVCFFPFFVFCFCFCFLLFGGFKGQVRWPKGPPHLALNPPYVICFVFVFFGRV